MINIEKHSISTLAGLSPGLVKGSDTVEIEHNESNEKVELQLNLKL